MLKNGMLECSVCQSKLVSPSAKTISRAYDKHRSSVSAKNHTLNVLLVFGDCILVGLQPILVYMSKVDGSYKFSPISVNFLTEATKVLYAIVMLLLQKEGDITVIEVQCVPTKFHARFRALERTLLSGPQSLPLFEKDRAWHVSEELDILAIKKACSILVGHHDFSSFRAAGCQATSPVKTLDELDVCEVAPFLCFPSSTERREMSYRPSSDDTPSSNLVPGASTESIGSFGYRSKHRCFLITAKSRSFLYHQVRLLVGVLKSVGTGELTPEDVEIILNAKNVSAASPMAPACGLYLGNVKYHFF